MANAVLASAPIAARRLATRRERGRPPRAAIVGSMAAVVVLGALGGALADGHPSGLAAADVIWRALLAAGYALLAARAHPVAWLAAALPAVAATGPARLSALAALAIAGGVLSDRGRARPADRSTRLAPRPPAADEPVPASSAASPGREAAARGGPVARLRSGARRRRAWRGQPLWGAAAGALAAQGLLRLPGAWPVRNSAAVAGAALVPLAVSAYVGLSRRRRRRARRVALAGAVAALAVAWLYLLAVLGARGAVELGGERAVAASDAARAGDPTRAAEQFDGAAEAFDTAHRRLAAWYLRPALTLPVVGLHARALDVITAEGARVSAVAAATARRADPGRIRVVNGAVDLALVEEMAAPLAEAAEVFSSAGSRLEGTRGPWLVEPLASRLGDFTARVGEAARGAGLAADVVAQLPRLLGGEGPRHYFVGFTTPAEARHGGGLLADFAEVRAEGGRLRLTRSGSVAQLNDLDAPDKRLSGPPGYLARYGPHRPGRNFQNVTASPHFPDVGAVITELYPQAPGGQPIDGVVLLDPEALVAVLAVTGPVEVAGLGEPLSAANAGELLLRGQYFRFDPGGPGGLPVGGIDQQERYDFLQRATAAIFEALIDRTTLPGPRELGRLFGPPARQRRLLAFSPHAAEQALFTRLGLAGAFPDAGSGDLVGLFQSNAGQNKLDAYLHRELDYAVRVDPGGGEVDAVATVRLTNAVPGGPLPYEVGYNPQGLSPGTNVTQLGLYSPHRLRAVRVNGAPAPVSTADELGVRVYTVPLDIPAGQTFTVRFELEGRVRPGDYRLTVAHQPLPHADTVHVSVEARQPGWRPAPGVGWTVLGGRATHGFALIESRQIDVPLRRR